MKKIRLLADAHVFDSGFQGTTSFIKGLYNELVKKDDLEIYLAAGKIEALQEHFHDDRFHFIRLQSTNRLQRLMTEYPSVIKKYGIDVAHFQYIVPPVKRCRYIVTIHDLLYREFPEQFPLGYRLQKNILFKKAVRQADLLTTVSNHSARAIEKYFGIAVSEIIQTPNAVDTFVDLAPDKNTSRQFIRSHYGIADFLLYVARVEPRKNHELLINAFQKLENLQLVMIGHKSVRSPGLDRVLQGLPDTVQERIHWLEKIPQPDLIHFYNAARIFVYPSKAEGFGIPPLEAAALQTPVLCSSATAMQDYDFFGNYLFDPNNETEFFEKLNDIVVHQPDAEQLAAIAEAIRKKYSWEFSAEQIYRGIKSLKISERT